MSAREIIAREFRVQHQNVCYPNASDGECQIVADSILSALTAAGYRIIGPGELDRETLERAAEVADKRAELAAAVSHEAAIALLVALSATCRALAEQEGRDDE